MYRCPNNLPMNLKQTNIRFFFLDNVFNVKMCKRPQLKIHQVIKSIYCSKYLLQIKETGGASDLLIRYPFIYLCVMRFFYVNCVQWGWFEPISRPQNICCLFNMIYFIILLNIFNLKKIIKALYVFVLFDYINTFNKLVANPKETKQKKTKAHGKLLRHYWKEYSPFF